MVTTKPGLQEKTPAGESISSPNPLFILVGVPGSGMTRLGKILDAHPDLAVAPDVDWVLEFFETRTGLNLEGLLAAELVGKWVEQKRFDPFGLDRDAIQGLIAPGECLPYRCLLTGLLDLYGKARGKLLVGSTTLHYMGNLPALRALWPNAQFVHLIQDGRDVFLSVREGERAAQLTHLFPSWGEDAVATAAAWWEWHVRRACADDPPLGPEWYCEVRFEALVAQPAQEFARLCAFLGVPYDGSMFRFHKGRTRVRGVLRDWRVQMAAAEVERFEAVAGDLLDELGYPRAAPRPRPETARHAAQVREDFARAASGSPAVSPETLRRRRRDSGWTNPFVFVVGCPRSGTTLLQRLLDAHPDLAICDESFWIPYFFKKRIGLTPDGLVTPQLISRLSEYYKFYRMKIGRDELEGLIRSEGSVDYANFVSGLFDLYSEIRGKPLVGDKTPDYARNLPTLHALWPEAKFIHLIRDGRDVCLSAVNWKRKAARLTRLFPSWGEDSVATAAAWWEWHVRLAHSGGEPLGLERYCEVRYEALVERPAEECARLCAFLGVPYDGSMLRFHEGRTRVEGGLDAKNAWLPVTPGLRDWRVQMTAAEVERFEAVAGDLLDELGYPRAVPHPQPDVVAYASRIRNQFARDSQALGDWLP